MVGEFSDLNHTTVNLRNGGKVIILDNGAVIGAEAEAMLQALYSRSPEGLSGHLEVLAKRGAAGFMESYYVGYGHKSIGDCGTGTAFIEGVSMLAAKAVQDSSLYAGQEKSTRYVDFSEQPFIDPTRTEEGNAILEMQREFYLNAQEPTRESLKGLYPQGEGEKDSVYQKAINARALDITRSLLPAGASTNLAWHTNLRQFADRMLFLRHHPLSEVGEIGEGLEEALRAHYPHSFGHKRYDETEAYQALIGSHYFYHDPESPIEPIVDFRGINFDEIKRYEELLRTRPKKTELPKFLSNMGIVDARFRLDFGSFRDIQRHRAINQRMPLITTDFGFNSWYLENLPGEVRENLPEHLERVSKRIGSLGISSEEAQYFLPMGYNVANRFTGDLPATIYMVELRDSRFVHPTLQRVAHSLGEQITRTLGIPLHVDPEPNRFDIRRGQQDIVIKE